LAIPFLILCDAPNRSTGLARIARDLTTRLHADAGTLGIRVGVAGLRWDGSRWPWPVYGIEDEDRWGYRDLPQIWQQFTHGEGGILFSVWDPGRCFETVELDLHGCRRWGYFAVDAENIHGTLSGPAADAIRAYERVLAYGEWGSRVLRPLRQAPVPYLPHGLDLGTWQPVRGAPRRMVGCVAANQARKDLGLLFAAWKEMREADPSLLFWLHTDLQVTAAWSIPQLAEDFGFNTKEGGLIVTTNLRDEELAGLYSQCLVTIAPGLGEGFGYPIVESLACGTPVVHGEYGGGAELIPRAWQVDLWAERIEGAYALKRPVYAASSVADMALGLVKAMRENGAVMQAACRGMVAHLDWRALWPRWSSWFRGSN